MKKPTLKETAIAIISVLLGGVGVQTYNYSQEAQNEAPENRTEQNALALSAEYSRIDAFNLLDFVNPLYTTEDYTTKDQCRVDYQFAGSRQISHPLSIHVDVQQEPGTPGGTSVVADAVDYDPQTVLFRLRSNKRLTDEEILRYASPPEGWMHGKWLGYSITKTYDNCLPPPSRPQPKR